MDSKMITVLLVIFVGLIVTKTQGECTNCTNCTYQLQDQAILTLPTGLQVTVGRPELCINGIFYPICYHAIINDTNIPQKICSSVLSNVREASIGAAIGDGSLYTLSVNALLRGVRSLYVDGFCAPMFDDAKCSGLYAVISCFSFPSDGCSAQSVRETNSEVINYPSSRVERSFRPELCTNNSIYIDICGDNYSENVIEIICNTLYNTTTSSSKVNYEVTKHGQANSRRFAVNFTCFDNLNSCTYVESSQCNQPLVVQCIQECDDGFIRFVEETVKLDDSGSSGPLITGISEVCINNTWASICDESYLELNSSEAIQQAQLFCDGLGYAGGQFIEFDANIHGVSNASIVITNLSCSDNFSSFEESCNFDFADNDDCLQHAMDIIVQCSANTPSCEVSPISPATFYERTAALMSNQVLQVTGYLQFCNPETNTSLLVCNSVTTVPQVVSDICIQNGFNTGGMVVNSTTPNPRDYFDRPVFSQGVFEADCSNECNINITDIDTGCISYNGIDLVSCRRLSTANCIPGELLPLSQGSGSLPNNTRYITLRIEYCNNISVLIPVCRNALESIIQDLCSSLLPGSTGVAYPIFGDASDYGFPTVSIGVSEITCNNNPLTGFRCTATNISYNGCDLFGGFGVGSCVITSGLVTESITPSASEFMEATSLISEESSILSIVSSILVTTSTMALEETLVITSTTEVEETSVVPTTMEVEETSIVPSTTEVEVVPTTMAVEETSTPSQSQTVTPSIEESPSPSPSPTPIYTDTELNNGVIMTLENITVAMFNSRREEFKNVTAEAVDSYCQTMSCSTVQIDGMSAKKRAIPDNLRQLIKRQSSSIVIELDDIIITNVREVFNGIEVTFHVRGGQSSVIIGRVVQTALQQASEDGTYDNADFIVSSIILVVTPSTTPTSTESPSETPTLSSSTPSPSETPTLSSSTPSPSETPTLSSSTPSPSETPTLSSSTPSPSQTPTLSSSTPSPSETPTLSSSTPSPSETPTLSSSTSSQSQTVTPSIEESPSPSPTPIYTDTELNNGVIMTLENITVAMFNSRREEFKNVTAEVVDSYCQTMSCSTVQIDGMSAKKRAIPDNLRQLIKRQSSSIVIELDDIIITNVREVFNGIEVTFHVRGGQSSVIIGRVVQAPLQQAIEDGTYDNADFIVSSIILVVTPSTTPTSTESPSETPTLSSSTPSPSETPTLSSSTPSETPTLSSSTPSPSETPTLSSSTPSPSETPTLSSSTPSPSETPTLSSSTPSPSETPTLSSSTPSPSETPTLSSSTPSQSQTITPSIEESPSPSPTPIYTDTELNNGVIMTLENITVAMFNSRREEFKNVTAEVVDSYCQNMSCSTVQIDGMSAKKRAIPDNLRQLIKRQSSSIVIELDDIIITNVREVFNGIEVTFHVREGQSSVIIGRVVQTALQQASEDGTYDNADFIVSSIILVVTPSTTPTSTDTPSETPTLSSSTPSPSETPTLSSSTPSPSETPTLSSSTPSPSETPTLSSSTPSPSETPTLSSSTPSPSETPTLSSSTPSPSETPTLSSSTPSQSQTVTPSIEESPSPSPTPIYTDTELNNGVIMTLENITVAMFNSRREEFKNVTAEVVDSYCQNMSCSTVQIDGMSAKKRAIPDNLRQLIKRQSSSIVIELDDIIITNVREVFNGIEVTFHVRGGQSSVIIGRVVQTALQQAIEDGTYDNADFIVSSIILVVTPSTTPTSTESPSETPTLSSSTPSPSETPTLSSSTPSPSETPTLSSSTPSPSETPTLSSSTPSPSETPTLSSSTPSPSETPTLSSSTPSPSETPTLSSSTPSPSETPTLSSSTSSPSETPTLSSSTPSPSETPTLPTPTPGIIVLPYISLTNPVSLSKSTFFSSNRVNPRRGLTIGSNTHTSLFVNYNGAISLSRRFLSAIPQLFPSFTFSIRDSLVFAPLWNFNDIQTTGDVSYQVFSDDSSSDQSTLDEVNNFISAKQNVSFKGVWMIAVEWKNVVAFPYTYAFFTFPQFYSNTTRSQVNRRNTYQAIIITDEASVTYVIYTYKCGDLQWDTYSSAFGSVIGYNIPGSMFNNHPLSGRRNEIAGILDCTNRNAGSDYYNILYVFSIDQDAVQRCLEARNNDILRHQSSQSSLSFSRFFFAQRCPCQLWLVWFDFRWSFLGFEGQSVICYANRRFGFSGICCYDWRFGFIVNEGPSASRVTQYNPFFSPNLYNQFDLAFRNACCIDSPLCDVYHSRRPNLFCYFFFPFRFSWNFGDPHITTLDGRTYTFNGLGEYVMTRITDEFELQARTIVASDNTTATIFSAVAMGGNGASELKERVQIEKLNNVSMTVLVNGTDVISNLTSVDNTVQYDTVTLVRRTQDTITATFSNNVVINVTLRVGVLSFVVMIPQDILNATDIRGLFGNSDGDKTNEFVYRNGTMLPDDSSDRILHTFGQSWQITQEESLFSYPMGQGVANFSDPNHEPQFLDELDNKTRQEAEAVCGGSENIQCIFDFSQTGNKELALDTQRTLNTSEENQRIADNTAPRIEASEQFIVTINETSVYIMNITDPEDTINVTVNGNLPAGYNLESMDSIYTLTFTITSIMEDLMFTVIATDPMGASSAIQPQVRICGCQNGGNCTIEGVVNTSSNPLIFLCDCTEAYDGDFCQNDADGCREIECFNNSQCTDNIAPAIGGTCPPCPSGFTGNGTICADVDECADNSLGQNCSQNCVNTYGSFECQCNSGFELDPDGRTCNDINECTRFLHNCEQICINTIGSFNCSCQNGFNLQNDSRSCVVDPDRMCSSDNDCEQFCVLSLGGSGDTNMTSMEICSCRNGFNLIDMTNCSDINECNSTNNPCEQGCNNTDGSFICECNTGYTLGSDGVTCNDIDECFNAIINQESLCPGNQMCQNIPGNFTCVCEEGSVLQGIMCVVITSSPTPTPTSSITTPSMTPSPSPSLSPSPSPSPSPNYTDTELNNGVIMTLENITVAMFNSRREEFKNVTAEALNRYCQTMSCSTVDGMSAKKRAISDNLRQFIKRQSSSITIEPDDIIITNVQEVSNGIEVTFHVRGGQNRVIIGAAVRAALQQAIDDGTYDNAGFTVAGIILVVPPSTTTPTPAPTESDKGLSAGAIAGIVIGSVIFALLIVVLIIILVFVIYKLCSKSGRYAFVEKGIKGDDDFAVENVYYEPRAPSPEGSVHSMKLTFVQGSSEDEDDDDEPKGKKETQSQEKLGKGELEESEETHL